MWAGVIAAALCAAAATVYYVIHSSRKAEMQKYRNAARKMVKEGYLNQAIQNNASRQTGELKTMVCLKWKDHKSQSFVFDPEQGIRIGRAIGENEVCVRDAQVSGRHCVIYLLQGQVVAEDLCSSNGTYVKHGVFRQRISGVEPLYTGDCLIVGSMKIKVSVFTFNTAYV